jgi:hypothetical protein
MNKIAIISAIGSAASLVVIVVLTRQRKIREQYALIWLAMGSLILVFSLFKRLLDLIARLVGIYYAPSLLIVLAIFFGLVLGIHFTVVLSRLTENNKRLVQEIGLLKNRVEQVEKSRLSETAKSDFEALPG